MKLRHRSSILPWILLASGCTAGDAPSDPARAAVDFDGLFEPARETVLMAPDSAPVDVTTLRADDGRFIVADGRSESIRIFDTATGDLVRSFGRAGRGPGEFAGLSGADATGDGSVCGVETRSNRLVCFPLDRDTATVTEFGGSMGLGIKGVGDGRIVVAMQAGPANPQIAVVSPVRGPDATMFIQDSTYATAPYFNSLYGVAFAVSDDRVFAASRLFYPLRVFDLTGDSLGTIGAAPPTWGQAQVVEPGTFAGPTARRDLATWLRQTSVISDVLVIADSLVLVLHGEYRPVESAPPPVFFQVHPANASVFTVDGDLVAHDLRLPGRPVDADSLLYVEATDSVGTVRVLSYRVRSEG